MMPELGGVEASREIRSISSAPILFLTAKSQERDMLQAYQSGGDDYLVKLRPRRSCQDAEDLQFVNCQARQCD